MTIIIWTIFRENNRRKLHYRQQQHQTTKHTV